MKARVATDNTPFTEEMLKRAVRSITGSSDGELLDWSSTPLHGGLSESFGAVCGVYRVTGRMRSADRTIPWSLILKVIGRTDIGREPHSPFYWRREFFVHRSELRRYLPEGLELPRCYSLDESDSACWIWQEDCGEMGGTQMNARAYAKAARLLGRLSGAFLGRRPPESWTWLSQGFLRSWIPDFAPQVELLTHLRDNPVVRRLYPKSIYETVMKLWTSREKYFALLDELPQTLCHLDANPRNMAIVPGVAGEMFVKLTDWASFGGAALGEDLGMLVWDSYVFFTLNSVDLDELLAITFDEYLAGLRDAGFRGSEADVLQGYRINTAFHYLTPMGLDSFIDESRRAELVRVFGVPIEELIERLADIIRRMVSQFESNLADAAR